MLCMCMRASEGLLCSSVNLAFCSRLLVHGGSGVMAANVALKPPGKFDFKCPDAWPKWKRRFQQYIAATGLDKEEDARKISTLLYCLGEESDDVLTSTNISEEDRKKYNAVVAKFDSFFNVRRNIIYERARFNRRDQLEGESAEQYITCLYSLVETCEYGKFKEEMLRDRLVVGMRCGDVTKAPDGC